MNIQCCQISKNIFRFFNLDFKNKSLSSILKLLYRFLSLNFNFDEKYFQGIYYYLTTLNVTNVPYSIVTKVTNFCNNFQARAREGMCYVSRGILNFKSLLKEHLIYPLFEKCHFGTPSDFEKFGTNGIRAKNQKQVLNYNF